MAKLKEVFDSKDTNGNSIKLAIKTPSSDTKQKAKFVFAKAWREALDNGVLLMTKLDSYLRQQNIWDDDREAEYQRLREALLSGEEKLGNGDMTLEEAKSLALQMQKDRSALADLLSVRQAAEANTCEKLAEGVQFNFLVAACTVDDETGKPYFTGLDNFLERGSEQAAIDAFWKMHEMWYGSVKDSLASLPENQFLKDYGFVNDEYRLVNEAGHLVDETGKLIDENGRFVNEAGEFVDSSGRRVDAEGKFIVEFKPFRDKDGNPVAPKTK